MELGSLPISDGVTVASEIAARAPKRSIDADLSVETGVAGLALGVDLVAISAAGSPVGWASTAAGSPAGDTGFAGASGGDCDAAGGLTARISVAGDEDGATRSELSAGAVTASRRPGPGRGAPFDRPEPATRSARGSIECLVGVS